MTFGDNDDDNELINVQNEMNVSWVTVMQK